MILDGAHMQGVRIIGATLTPFKGVILEGYDSDPKNNVRKEAHNWIRISGTFDGVIDFDKALRGPVGPDLIRNDYNCGDNLHPNDAGYKAMANAVDLILLFGN